MWSKLHETPRYTLALTSLPILTSCVQRSSAFADTLESPLIPFHSICSYCSVLFCNPGIVPFYALHCDAPCIQAVWHGYRSISLNGKRLCLHTWVCPVSHGWVSRRSSKAGGIRGHCRIYLRTRGSWWQYYCYASVWRRIWACHRWTFQWLWCLVHALRRL